MKANYLASPPLVVAYALAGRVDLDLTAEPIGVDGDGNAVFLRDVWPSQDEIGDTIARALKPDMFEARYGNVFEGNEMWNAVGGQEGISMGGRRRVLMCRSRRFCGFVVGVRRDFGY